jgi:hypothetical protein
VELLREYFFYFVVYLSELPALTTVNIGSCTLKINLISLVTNFQKLTDRTLQATNIVVIHCSMYQEVSNKSQILNVINFNMCLEPRVPILLKI